MCNLLAGRRLRNHVRWSNRVDPHVHTTLNRSVIIPVSTAPPFPVDDFVRVVADTDPRIFRSSAPTVLSCRGFCCIARFDNCRKPLAVDLKTQVCLHPGKLRSDCCCVYVLVDWKRILSLAYVAL